MLTKTTLRVHLTPVRVATIKKTSEVGEDLGEKGILIYCWCECNLMQPLWKLVWRVLHKKKKVTIEVLYDSAVSPLGIYPKKGKLAYNRDTCTPMFTQHYS
jgi:hypothetical protein